MKKLYMIMLLTSILAFAVFATASSFKTASAQNIAVDPYYSITPAVTPVTAVGDEFAVTLSLNNVTTDNVPAGIQGVEVHLAWNTSLIVPLNFTSYVGTSTGPLLSPVIYGLNSGFYDINNTIILSAPYTNAATYNVAGASTGGSWWSANSTAGTIAVLYFQVISAPTPPFTVCPLTWNFTDLVDSLAAEVTHVDVNATVLMKATSTFTGSINFVGIDWPISIASDSNVTLTTNLGFQNISNDGASFMFNVENYTSDDVYGWCNVTVPNNFMWSVPTNNWTVLVDSASPSSMQFASDSNNWYIWFNFSSGIHTVTLDSTNVVPEFPVPSLLMILMAATLIGAGVATNLRKRKFQP